MSRYWDAPSDLDAYPPQDHGYWPEMEQALDEDREGEADWLAGLESERADFGHFLTSQRREKHNAESPRRQKLFRKAQATIAVMVALRGVYGSPVTVTAWYGRHGRRLGLFTYYDEDHEIQWTPRRGFRVIEIQDIPF